MQEKGGFDMAEQDENKSKDNKIYRISINGTEVEINQDILSYEEIVKMAFPSQSSSTIYSVSFEKARQPKEGDLVAGQSVEIEQNTEIDVDDTGRS